MGIQETGGGADGKEVERMEKKGDLSAEIAPGPQSPTDDNYDGDEDEEEGKNANNGTEASRYLQPSEDSGIANLDPSRR